MPTWWQSAIASAQALVTSSLQLVDCSRLTMRIAAAAAVQVVSCKDELAQQYLMQCIIQGFPDAFHLATLDALLGALPELQPGVRLHAVMASLMDRLAR